MPQVAPLSPREAWRRRETWTASIAWAKELLASKERRHELCQQEFEKADANGGESLDRGEIMTVVKRICQEKFQLELPTDEKCNELFAKCDKNGDGSKAMKTEDLLTFSIITCANPRVSPRVSLYTVLQLKEFNSYFKCVLESAILRAERELEITLVSEVVNSPSLERTAKVEEIDSESPVIVRRPEPSPTVEEALVEAAKRTREQVRANEWVEKQRGQVHVEKEAEQRKYEAVVAGPVDGWSASLLKAQRWSALAVLAAVAAVAISPLLPPRGARAAQEATLTVAAVSMLWATATAFLSERAE